MTGWTEWGVRPLRTSDLLDDFGNTFFLTIGHQVYSGNAINILNPLNELDAELLALGFLLHGTLKSRNDVVGKYGRPARFARIHRAARAEARGPTPTRMKHFS